MMIKDIIDLLLAHNPNANALLMTNRKQPFENHLVGVVARSEMADQVGRVEAGIATDDVFLVVGKRIRPGSLSAWIVAERVSGRDQPVDRLEQREAAIAAVARCHLQLDTLDPDDPDYRDFCDLTVGSIRRALTDAYRAGIAAGFQRYPADGEPDQVEQLGTEDDDDGSEAGGAAGVMEGVGDALAAAP
ncbi:MAG: hypothetical protein ABIY55_22815 [Kofleriaceae bacterium]